MASAAPEEVRIRLGTGLESILNNELEVKIMKIEGTETETLTFKYCSFYLLNNFYPIVCI